MDDAKSKKFPDFSDFNFHDDILENSVLFHDILPVVLLLDCSGSMSTTDSTERVSRIEIMKRCLKNFVNTTVISNIDKERIDLCVIAFDSNVTIVKGFTSMSEIGDDFSTLRASGSTSLYSALIIGVQLARRRRNEIMNAGVGCFKPILFLITGSAPTDKSSKEECQKILKHCVNNVYGKAKMHLVICGMEQCNMNEMNNLCAEKTLIALRSADALEEAFKLLTSAVVSYWAVHTSDEWCVEFDHLKNLGVIKNTSRRLNLGY